jgi:hypothetical protein
MGTLKIHSIWQFPINFTSFCDLISKIHLRGDSKAPGRLVTGHRKTTLQQEPCYFIIYINVLFDLGSSENTF